MTNKRRGLNFNVEFEFEDDRYRAKGFQSAVIPAVMYLANGDPGYPAEGGEIEEAEIFAIAKDGTETKIEELPDGSEPFDNQDFYEVMERAVNDYAETLDSY